MAIVKVTFPDGTSYSNQSPDDVTDPNETGLADGGHDPGLLRFIEKVLAHSTALIQSIGGLGAAVSYTFSVSQVDGDPGAGKLRFDAGTNAATEIYASLTSSDGQDVTALFDVLGDVDNPDKGFVAVRQADDNSKWAISRLQGVVAGVGYRKLVITPLAPVGAVEFASGVPLTLSFSQSGDQGDQGVPGGGLASVVEDATPQLGGALDVDGNPIISTADGDIELTPDGAGETKIKNPTASGTMTVGGAVNLGYDNLGDVSTATTVTAVPYTRARLIADTTITLTAPASSYLGVRMLEIVQDGTGGRVPTFIGYTWLGSEPDWAAQDPDSVTVVGWYVTPTGLARIYVIEEEAS